MRLFFWRKKVAAPTFEVSALEAAGFGYLDTEILVNNWGPTVLTHLGEYVKALETGETDEWCRCLWMVHPDDTELPRKKQRRRRKEDKFDCPVHTKEGMILGFLEWMKTHAA